DCQCGVPRHGPANPRDADSAGREGVESRRGASGQCGPTQSVGPRGEHMIAAIVLAAGRSRRMGTQKLLLPWSGQTVIGHIVDQVLAAGLNQVCVVVGADREAVSQALGNRPVTLITNPDPDAEMLSSVRCGIQSLPMECDAAMIVLG